MPYGECKIYSDGSHYIAIPHTTRPYKPGRKPSEEIIEVDDNGGESVSGKEEEVRANEERGNRDHLRADEKDTENVPNTDICIDKKEEKANRRPVRLTTRRELFEELYTKYINLPRSKRKDKILKEMRGYFDSEEAAERYVTANTERKWKNLISRRIRLVRKAYLHEFNYFVMFTYDGAIHTEDSFRKKLRNTLSHLCSRKGWRYIGVWERSPEKKRLHFHGIFGIPEGTMPGSIEENNGFSFGSQNRKIINENSYFKKHFGRNDFESLDDANRKGEAIAYLLKYIEKSGESIVYSRGLSQYFISDVMEEDIICPIGIEDKKLLLFDDFGCWDEGVYIGQVNMDTISQMRKAN